MKLKIITPQGITYDGEAGRVQFRSATGLLEVLPGHAPMIAELCPGAVTADSQELQCGAGVVRVENDAVTVLCE